MTFSVEQEVSVPKAKTISWSKIKTEWVKVKKPVAWGTGEGESEDTFKVASAILKDLQCDPKYQITTNPPTISATAKCPVRLLCFDSSNEFVPSSVEEAEEGKTVACSWDEDEAKHLLVLNAYSDYKILVAGEDAGTFDMTVIRNADKVTHAYYEEVPVGNSSKASIIVGKESTYSMDIDKDGDGTVDQTVLPPSLETTGGGGEPPSGFNYYLLVPVIILLVAVLFFTKRDKILTYVPVFTRQVETKPTTTQIPKPVETQLTCPDCGTINAASCTYCMKCGRILQQFSFCEECGKQIPAGSIYCTSCGDKQRAD